MVKDLRKWLIVLVLMVKYVSFTESLLLIIISRVILDDWNAINKSMLVEKNNKCCICIIKGQKNWDKTLEKRT